MQRKTHIHTLLEVLSIKPFFSLWISQVLSQIAFNMLIFVVGILVYQKTRTVTAVSLLNISVSIPAAIFSIFTGLFVDRLDKRLVLIATTLTRAGLMLLLIATSKITVLLYVWVALLSAVTQFFVPAEAALIPRFVSKEYLLTANSLFIMTFYTAIVGGFIVGGVLLEHVGASFLFMLLFGLFLVSAAILWSLPHVTDYSTGYEKITFVQLRADLFHVGRYIRGFPAIFQAIMLLTLAQAIIQIFVTVGPGFADKILAIKITDASVFILGPASLGMILGALFVGSFGNRFRKRELINTGIFLSGFLLVFMSILVIFSANNRFESILERFFRVSSETGMLPVSVICFFIIGVANSLIDVSCNTVLQEQSHESLRGKIYGILQALINGVAILPVLISGVIADLFGIEKIILLLGIVLLGFGMYTSGIYRRIFAKISNSS